MTKPLATTAYVSFVACETSALYNLVKEPDIECLCNGTNQGKRLNHFGSLVWQRCPQTAIII